MLTEQQIADYKRSGYILIRNFWDTNLLDNIHNQAKLIFFKQMKSRIDVDENILKTEEFDEAMFMYFEVDPEGLINCGKQIQHLISLFRISTEDKLVTLLKSVGLDFPNISVRPSMFFNSRHLDKKGHYWKLDAHQDWRSSQGSLDSVTIWYPYVDCNKDLGALEVIPGSHLWGLLDCEKVDYYSKIKIDIDESEYVPIEMKKGDLLLFSSFTVHRSGTNSTRKIRWSSQLRYNNMNEKTFIDLLKI
jgi:phytanoyl-CoA hydroxylase